MQRNPSLTPHLRLGAAYYPEHWPESRWAEDIRLMQEGGLTVVRMAEFAWSTMEPSEGQFNLDWLERIIESLAKGGIQSVLGTPTAAPPAWLVQKYPDVLAVEETGRRVQFGNRCHYCVNSPEFHAATRRIVTAMADRFGKNPHVIGWQIDNEYNRVCYCDHCLGVFQQYLQEKFGSLDSLNERWATRYWSEAYSGWEQIPIPIGPHNPGLMLEFKHFIGKSYREFQKLQLDILRRQIASGTWITHNFMGWFDGFDHYELARDLDMAAWDWYVGTGHHDYLTSGAVHDLTRGLKRRNFWLMETQPGHVNWTPLNSELDKGEMRAMAWHAIAHGAEAVLYWQWRPAAGGQEQYHGSLIDPSGQPRPLFEEIWQIGEDFKAAGSLLAEAPIRAQAAILNCYDSRWAIHWQRHHKDFQVEAHFNHYFRSLAGRNIDVDILSADEPLDGYTLVIAPTLLILKDQRVDHLREFVRQGGTLVLTLRSGMKDEFNALLPSRQPGPLAELAGVEVEDFYALQNPTPVQGELFQGSGKIWAERLKSVDSEWTLTLARYCIANGWLDGQAAITAHPYGRGRVYYVGTWLDEVSQEALMEHILVSSGIKYIKTPPEVELHQRLGNSGETIFLIINHGGTEKTIPWQTPGVDLLSRQEIRGDIVLPSYGVTLLTVH